MVDELASLGPAIRTYLRESSVLASAEYLGSNTKIYLGLPRDRNNQVNVPTFTDIIVIETGRGGPGSNDLKQQGERVDIFCYGTDESKCKKLWRALDAYLFPIGERRRTSFTRNNCQVNVITREGGPNTLVDPDLANWPYTLGTYIFNYNGEPK